MIIVESERRVVCAAIRAGDGSLLLGIRHYSQDMHEQIKHRDDGAKFMHRSDKDQGFVDQWGVWMSRREAFGVANSNGQLRHWTNGETKLYSEDLY